jgi:hypothetical protein
MKIAISYLLPVPLLLLASLPTLITAECAGGGFYIGAGCRSDQTGSLKACGDHTVVSDIPGCFKLCQLFADRIL